MAQGSAVSSSPGGVRGVGRRSCRAPFEGFWGSSKADIVLILKVLDGCFYNLGLLTVDVLTVRALLFGVHIRAPGAWKLPCKTL